MVPVRFPEAIRHPATEAAMGRTPWAETLGEHASGTPGARQLEDAINLGARIHVEVDGDLPERTGHAMAHQVTDR